jgi:hypothetical protein
MNEHLGRRIAAFLVGASVSMLAIDCAGALATRAGQASMHVVVRVPSTEPAARGKVRAMRDAMLEIYRHRLDPAGERELLVQPEGEDRIAIDLVLRAANPVRPTIALASALDAGARTAVLATAGGGEAASKAFPEGGGAIEVDGEVLLYRRRLGKRLVGLTRGAADAAQAHAAGALVSLVTDEPLGALLTSQGELQFAIGASSRHFAAFGLELEREQAEVMRWMSDHPDAASLEEYNARPLPLINPTTLPRIVWCTMAEDAERGVPFANRQPVPVVGEENPAWRFGGADLVGERYGNVRRSWLTCDRISSQRFPSECLRRLHRVARERGSRDHPRRRGSHPTNDQDSLAGRRPYRR